ncbi:MAG TPA: hypothetical protein VLH15_05985, partial [Dehalococcoidales bacterium]|nr:hypothetical protein [Dehalococcoidales bacterium]
QSPQIPNQPETPGDSTFTTTLTLEKANEILNILFFLPRSFEKVDAASEGLSNAQMGLGPDFCEVQLFVSDNPYQTIYCFLGLIESRIERATSDALLRDEIQMSNLIMESLKQGAQEEGVNLQNTKISITYPAIGILAMLGEGSFSVEGFTFGFDTLWFRAGNAYVFIYSIYYSQDRTTLIPIAKQIEQRLAGYFNTTSPVTRSH